MSILTDASLIITPNAVKSGSLLAVVPSNGNGDLTWTRNSGAPRVNSEGLIENVLANVPRLDYSLGGCPSILLEPQRTNRLLNSEILITQSLSTTGLACAVSFYGTGIITFSGTFTGTLVGTGVNNRVSIVFTPTTGTLTLTVSGSVTKAQLEQGAYPTSYIPTTSATVTRVADVASKTGISSLINSEEGVFFLEASTFIEGGSIRLISLTDGTSANRISFTFHSTNNRIQAFGQKNNAPLFNLDTTTAIQTSFNKIAIKFITGNVKFFMNGLLIGSATTTDFFAGNTLNSLVFEAGNNSLFFEGKLKSLQLYKTPLTDTQCIQLTTL